MEYGMMPGDLGLIFGDDFCGMIDIFDMPEDCVDVFWGMRDIVDIGYGFCGMRRYMHCREDFWGMRGYMESRDTLWRQKGRGLVRIYGI